MNLPDKISFKIRIFLLLVFISGCSFVSYYDAISFKNLTDLKGEMMVAFEDFSQNGAEGEQDLELLEHFKVETAKAMEYEAGKNLNDNTTAQFKTIYALVSEVVERFKNDGDKLSASYCEAKWLNLEEAFRIAIETERNKIQN
jgi:NADH:ubiquinone oxidoreductase subunit 3 (subunit A)